MKRMLKKGKGNKKEAVGVSVGRKNGHDNAIKKIENEILYY